MFLTKPSWPCLCDSTCVMFHHATPPPSSGLSAFGYSSHVRVQLADTANGMQSRDKVRGPGLLVAAMADAAMDDCDDCAVEAPDDSMGGEALTATKEEYDEVEVELPAISEDGYGVAVVEPSEDGCGGEEDEEEALLVEFMRRPDFYSHAWFCVGARVLVAVPKYIVHIGIYST